MQKLLTYIIIFISIFVTSSLQILAQGTSPVGVNFIIVNFDQPPTTLTVNEAPLKYNKEFALSMQIDDGDTTLFTKGYPVFEGGVVNGTTYPGLTYSDGCGNLHNFKMSASVFIFNGNDENGPDIHIDNSQGQLSWAQMDTVFSHNWGILNHGVNSSENPNPSFIDFSISRNKSYIRRKLYNTIDGGVLTSVFVNPNGNFNWTLPSFNLGNISALNQNETFPMGQNGGNVNASNVDWTQPYSLYRQQVVDINVIDYVNNLADSSVSGANYWGSIFTQSLSNHYLFNDFTSDFNYIAGTYGVNGQDNILMASDEEIQDYLIVRDATIVNHVINGTSLYITYSGEVPDNLLFYSSSIVITSDATISNIIIDGNDDYTYTGVGNTDALINLNWNGNFVIPAEYLADSMVTKATNSQAQYDAWIAMDYVITLTNGTHKDSLRKALCNIPNIVYDEGFCECEINIQPTDTTINNGDCIDLHGAVGDYTYEWFVGENLIDTIQDINVCPNDTTQYNHIATNTFGCPAEDSIMVNVSFLSFDLGPDQTICENSCITIEGPDNMIKYRWYVADTVFDTTQNITPCPLEQTQYLLWVEDEYGATAEDSIVISLKPVPIVDFEDDSLYVNLGNNIMLTVNSSTGIGNDFTWYYNGNTYFTFTVNSYNLVKPDVSDYVYVKLQAENECIATDSSYLTILEYPEITVSNDTTICSKQPLTLKVSGGDIFLWIVNNDTISRDSIIHISPEIPTSYIAQTAYENSSNYSIDTIEVTIHNTTDTKILIDVDTVCTYTDVELTASGATHYLWTPGSDTTINYTFTVYEQTTIWLLGTNDDGCQSADSATIYAKALPTVSFSGLQPAFCENDSFVELIGTPDGGAFSGHGIVGNNFYPQSAGAGIHEIVYSYTNLENCVGYDTNSTVVYGNGGAIDLGPDFTIKTDSIKNLDAGSGFDNYFWNTGETTQDITVRGNDKTPGVYEYAVMGVINGCSSRGSVNITFENTAGISEQHISNLTIFPNPNTGNFIVKFNSVEKDIQLVIYNIQGKLVYDTNEFSCFDGCETEININSSEAGFYFLKIITSSGVSTAKIILE